MMHYYSFQRNRWELIYVSDVLCEIIKLFLHVIDRCFWFKISYNNPIALFIGEIAYRPIKTNHQSISKAANGHKVNNRPE